VRLNWPLVRVSKSHLECETTRLSRVQHACRQWIHGGAERAAAKVRWARPSRTAISRCGCERLRSQDLDAVIADRHGRGLLHRPELPARRRPSGVASPTRRREACGLHGLRSSKDLEIASCRQPTEVPQAPLSRVRSASVTPRRRRPGLS
jgi:hypothetical protein